MGLTPLACAPAPDRQPPPPPAPLYATPPAPSGRVSSHAMCPIDHARKMMCSGWDGPDSACLEPRMTQIMSSHGVTFDRALTDAHAAANPKVRQPCCYSGCERLEVAARGETPFQPPGPADPISQCFTAPEAGTSVPAPSQAVCPAAVVLGGTPRPLSGVTPSPILPQAQQCCYVDHFEPRQYYRGRPLQGASGPLLADVVSRDDWRGALSRAACPERAAEDVVEGWTAHAVFEHASVGAFARLALDLLALGAPPQLVTAAHEAARDEVRHARLSFALASGYGGRAIGPGPLTLPPPRPPSFAALVHDTFDGGCCGETVAAAIAEEAAATATCPAARRVLRIIARDELRHAELGWRVLAWAVRRSDEARRTLVALLAAEPPAAPSAPAELGPAAAYGLLGGAKDAEIERRVMRQVVHPCAQALRCAAADRDIVLCAADHESVRQ